ncbi:hypothetical protein [Lacisediminihabitans sp.]|uniref:hypothetical protein n=1 Tax=Lacisediminihabitans sp. TaxID=2787631 RepID=UPI00374DE468
MLSAVFDPLGAILLCPRVNDSARAEVLAEVREVRFRGVVVELRLLLGVEVVEVAEELIEPVPGRQVLVTIAEVVLAELSCGISVGAERRRDGRILRPNSCVRAGDPTLVRPVR